MAKYKIYHNPRCSKSRACLKIMTDNNLDVQIIDYLKTGLTSNELDDLSEKLGLEPSSFIRKKEQIFKEINLSSKIDDQNAVIQAITDHPKLLERPIVVKGEQAIIGRPPENVNELID